MNGHSSRIAGPGLGRCLQEELARGRDLVALSRFELQAGRLPAVIDRKLDRGASWREIGRWLALNHCSWDVVTVVAFEYEDLPIFDDGGPVLFHAVVKPLGEFERAIACG